MRSRPGSASRNPAARQALLKRLGAMAREGELLVNRAHEYCLVDRLSLVVGTVSGHRDGFGFLVPDDGGDDLFLPYREMRMLFHGDRAAARVTGPRRTGPAGGRDRRGARAAHDAGRRPLLVEGGIGFVTPDNRRISQRVLVPRDACGAARHGDLAVVEITEQPGRNRDPSAACCACCRTAAARIRRPSSRSTRTACRSSFRPKRSPRRAGYGARGPGRGAQGTRRPARDRRSSRSTARTRATSTMRSSASRSGAASGCSSRSRTSATTCGRARRSTPRRANARHLGLLPEPRAADAAGGAVERPVLADARGRSPVHGLRDAGDPRGRRVEEPLLPGRDALGGAAHLQRGRRVPRAARRPARRAAGRRRSRQCIDCLLHASTRRCASSASKRGALDFDAPEVKVLFDAAGRIRRDPRVSAQRRAPADRGMHDRGERRGGRLPEEASAADAVPGARPARGGPIEELQHFLSMRGVHLEICRRELRARAPAERALAGRSPAARMRPCSRPRSSARCRRRVYQPRNIGHFGLALEDYAHFTSPIRRYPDLLVHRGIRHVLGGGTAADFAHSARRDGRRSDTSARCASGARTRRRVASSPGSSACTCRTRIGEEFDAS